MEYQEVLHIRAGWLVEWAIDTRVWSGTCFGSNKARFAPRFWKPSK